MQLQRSSHIAFEIRNGFLSCWWWHMCLPRRTIWASVCSLWGQICKAVGRGVKPAHQPMGSSLPGLWQGNDSWRGGSFQIQGPLESWKRFAWIFPSQNCDQSVNWKSYGWWFSSRILLTMTLCRFSELGHDDLPRLMDVDDGRILCDEF